MMVAVLDLRNILVSFTVNILVNVASLIEIMERAIGYPILELSVH